MLRREFFLVVLAAACQKKKEFRCTDETGLTPADVAARRALAYAEPSGDPARACEACQQWVPGDACGKCKVLAGPIHPNGTCRSFTPKS